MSGFEFEVATADATVIGRLTTAADGRTPPIEAVAGTYTIREIGRPSWAGGLGDPGAVTFTFEPTDVREDDSDVREIVYVNTVPPASISTAARDAADGDHVVDLERGAATIIDTVTYTSLVPGTGYVVTGELMVRPSIARGDGDHPTEAITTGTDPAGATVASSAIELTEMIPTGITGSTSFVPDRPDGSVDVEFTLPADSPLTRPHRRGLPTTRGCIVRASRRHPRRPDRSRTDDARRCPHATHDHDDHHDHHDNDAGHDDDQRGGRGRTTDDDAAPDVDNPHDNCSGDAGAASAHGERRVPITRDRGDHAGAPGCRTAVGHPSPGPTASLTESIVEDAAR